MSVEQKCRRVNAAAGREKADLVIRNARVINVFTGEIIPGDIAVLGDMIVGIGEYSGQIEIDADGMYACPGLIDSHVHIESSMVTPAEFARAILPHGTTTLVADPHEIANVCGLEGIHFMLDHTRSLPVNMYFMIPSCVPATSFEDNGASLTAEAMAPYLGNPRILGLGEVMDYTSVLSCNSNMLKKIDLFDHGIIDGHSAGIKGRELSAYRAAGIMTNHECATAEEVMENLRLGMYVQIREGSAARNLETIVRGLLEAGVGFERCLFCTDDKHLSDIRQEGHISHNVRKAIHCGVKPVDAIRMATLNAARCYRLKRLGAIAPGYSADMLLLSDLEDFQVEKVFFRGSLVSEKGRYPDIQVPIEDSNVFNTVRIPHLTEESLEIRIQSGDAYAVTLVPGQLATRKEKVRVDVDSRGCFLPSRGLNKLAVIERHKSLGSVGLGVVKGFGIQGGALASTVAHDSHNLIVLGDNDRDMLEAVEELKRCGGGLTVVSEGKVLDTLPLPVAGLMSDCRGDLVESKLTGMILLARKLGVTEGVDPFVTMSFLALPVIPELRVTDRGLFDVTKFEFISVDA